MRRMSDGYTKLRAEPVTTFQSTQEHRSLGFRQEFRAQQLETECKKTTLISTL